MSVFSSTQLVKLEQNMRALSESAYNVAQGDLFWPKVMKELPSQSEKENLFWLLNSGGLGYGTEGNVQFADAAVQYWSTTPKFITPPGLRLLKSQLEDMENSGYKVAADWATQRGVEAALFPQTQLCATMISNPTCYDGVAYFHAASHLVHPKDSSVGTFANSFTGASSGAYPGALPITADATGTSNIGKALAYIRSIPSPNGTTPRRLKGRYLMVPPAMEFAARVATNSAYVNATDFRGVVDAFGLEIIVAPELGATYGGSDTTCYIFCEDVGSQLGAFIYTNREPANIAFYGPQNDATLQRQRVFEWTMAGRSSIDPGHPFLCFRLLAA